MARAEEVKDGLGTETQIIAKWKFAEYGTFKVSVRLRESSCQTLTNDLSNTAGRDLTTGLPAALFAVLRSGPWEPRKLRRLLKEADFPIDRP